MDIPAVNPQKLTKWLPLAFAVVFILILFNILFLIKLQKVDTPSPMTDFLEKEKNRLEKTIKALDIKADSLKNEITSRDLKIADIENQKNEIRYVYINKIKEVDNLYVNGLINDYKRILSTDRNSK